MIASLDWREVARERVFPCLGERLSAMRESHDTLLAVCLPTVERARAVLGYSDDEVARLEDVDATCRRVLEQLSTRR